MREWTSTEVQVLDAVKSCCERWGIAKVTIDDIAKQSGVSRASLYRMFPGGRDTLFEAHRVYELDQFFETVLSEIDTAGTLDALLTSIVVSSTRALRNDEHIAVMLASEPGEVAADMTVDGLPRIIRVASAYLAPLVDQYMSRADGRALIDVVSRLVISYFLAPSDHVDLADSEQAHKFLAPFIAPYMATVHQP